MNTQSRPTYLSPEWREAAHSAQSEAVCTGQHHVWSYDGASFSVPCCCNRMDRFERHLLKISALLDGKTLDNFYAEDPDETTANSRKLGLASARCLLDSWSVGAIFLGNEGTGKTHLGRAIARGALDEKRGISNWVRAIDLASLFRVAQGFDSRSEDATAEIHRLQRSALLVIDDVGSQRATKSDVWEEQLQNFIDGYGGILIITTNLSGHDLIESVGRKSYDRICERCVPVKMVGKSYRKEHRPELSQRLTA